MDAVDELAAAAGSGRMAPRAARTGRKPGQLGLGAIVISSLLFGLIWYFVGVAKQRGETPAPPVKVMVREPVKQTMPRSLFAPDHSPIIEKSGPSSSRYMPIRDGENTWVVGPAPVQRTHWVNGYVRANGTHVSGYWRR